ncbi:MAG: hypothetical protein Q7R57_00510 [Dehalococcoidales bacterium]|nr:hypothetical protein [Dehalococcoidales bacterium]
MPIGDHDALVAEQLQDLRLAGPDPVVQGEAEGLDPRPELPLVARGQRGEIALALGLGVVLLLVEQHVVGVEDHVLDHHLLVALELSIRGQGGWVQGQGLLPVDAHLVGLGILDPLPGGAPFLLGREVGRRGWRRLRGVGRDLGLALLSLEAGDLVPQPLVLLLGGPQGAHHLLVEIQQPDNAPARPLVLDPRQVEVSQNVGANPQERTFSVPMPES